MPHEPQAPPPEDRDSRMRSAVADYVREVVLGNNVTPEGWAKAHADLMPELAVELKKVQLIGAAYQRALSDRSPTVADPDQQVTLSYWQTDVSTLHVRCPHCHNPVDISGDSSLVDILCSVCGSSFSLLCDTLATPTIKKIGHFELVERLGIGGFGTVWKARDTKLDRTVAIKIPRAGRLGTAEIEVSFLREARAAAQLKHPGIVTVHEVGRQDDTIYIVSELVRGASLSEWLTAAQPTVQEAAQLCAKIADALHHAHEAGIVHRDLKPSNIMVDEQGQPHIMDFGLARRDVGEVTVTIDGQMLGTPAYMSPEHARGEAHQADRRSDVYSLGVILFQLLTGELPFRGQARMLMLQILRDEPPKPRSLKAAIPRDLQTICLKCLEKQPSKRYDTAADVAADLRRFLRGEPILARPITNAGRLFRWCKRQPEITALSAALLIALTAGILGASWYAIRSAEGRANLYHRMVGQVQAERTQRMEGYTSRVWQYLDTARQIDTPELDLNLLQQEAVLSLGDFQGYDPVTIASPNRLITVAAFHPQSKWLAIGYLDGRIELHDPISQVVVAKVSGYGKAIAALSFADDGKRLLSVDADGKVRAVETDAISQKQGASLSPVELFQADEKQTSFEFTPSGTHLVAYNESTATVWNVGERKHERRIDLPDLKLRSVRVSPDGKWLAASANTPVETASDRLLLWSVESGKLMREVIPERGIGYKRSLAFSHDSRFIAYGAEGLAVYRVPNLESHFFYRGDAVMAIAFSPDDRVLSLARIRDTVALWSMAANTRIASLLHARAVKPLPNDDFTVFSPDGRFLVSTRAYSARIWNLRGGGERIELGGHDANVPTMMFSPKEGYLATGSTDRSVRFWDGAMGLETLDRLSFGGKVQCLAFSQDGNWLATADWSDGDKSTPRLHISGGERFSVKTVITHKLSDGKRNRINGVTFSQDEKYFAACGSGMQLWRIEKADPATGKIELSEVKEFDGSNSLFVRFSPDASLLVWADNWRDLHVWDVEKAKELLLPAESKLHQGWHGLAFVEGGLAFVGSDLSVEVWDVRQGVKQFKIGEPGDFQAPHIAASPNGYYLAGLHSADTIALWDVRARKRLFLLPPERSEIWSLAFDSTNSKLGVGLTDGGVAIWDLNVIERELAKLDLGWLNRGE
jgi:WD40 repeat protein/tRNA A-37 threonylcarbamoyl transferase component Bud32